MICLLDTGTLDTLVLGTTEPGDEEAWESLVRDPEGARAWQGAVARRRRMDLVASAIRGRPWLARAVRRLSAATRRVKQTPEIALSVVFPDSELDALAAATLGPDDEQATAEIVEAGWGQIVPVRVRLGSRVSLQPSPDADAADVRYVCNGEEGALPGRTWKLESGEAPVLLVALVEASPADPLDEAMSRSTAMAGVLLLEDESDSEAGPVGRTGVTHE